VARAKGGLADLEGLFEERQRAGVLAHVLVQRANVAAIYGESEPVSLDEVKHEPAEHFKHRTRPCWVDWFV
jgi:hypothetical protein